MVGPEGDAGNPAQNPERSLGEQSDCRPQSSNASRGWMRRVAPAAVDVLAIVLFVAIGRASHHHAETVGGFLSTEWPFAVGVLAGWLVSARTSQRLLRSGLLVCLVTVAVGMVLRVVAGQGTAWAFVLVSLGFLGAVMIGGRVLLMRSDHLAGRRSSAAAMNPDPLGARGPTE